MEDSIKRKRIGEILLEKKLIDQKKLEMALETQKRTRERLGSILLGFNFVTESDLAQAIAKQGGYRYIEVSSGMINHEYLKRLGIKFCRERSILPLCLDGKESSIVFAMENPYDLETYDEVRNIYGNIDLAITTKSAIDEALSGYTIISKEEIDSSITDMEEDISKGEVRNFLENLFRKSVEYKATDIHFEPGERGSSELRLRIDGVLQPFSSISRMRHDSVANVLLSMAGGNPGDFTRPYEGKFSVRIEKRDIFFRLSCVPAVRGPSIVLRIHDRVNFLKPLEMLGYSEDNLSLIRNIVSKPQGMFLIVGPTGSGKTTTFYSLISMKKGTEIKIVTIEDPVEAHLSLIQQVQLNPKIGLDYPTAIKSFLRQDPDVMLVGEIRDYNTVHAAAEASMTGHLVFSTLHTNSALESILRLKDVGLSPVILSEILLAVVSQRLVRTLCQDCHGKGCTICMNTGYSGRTVVAEVLVCTPDISRLIRDNASLEAIKNQAISEGFTPIEVDCQRLIRAGITDKKEVERVTGLRIDI